MKKELLIILAVILLCLYACNSATTPSNSASITSNLLSSPSTVVKPQTVTDSSLPTSNQPSPSITPTQSETSATRFVGSVKSDKYHYPSCQWAKKISQKNEIWFSSTNEAKAKGYVPCKVCKPPAQ